MNNTKQRIFSLWGVLAFGLVVGGAALSRGVIAQEQPLFVSGADVPPAYEKGNWQATQKQMEKVYEIYKAGNWELTSVPFELWQHADQKYSEHESARQPNVSGFCVPSNPFYSEVAFWCETYFRRNIRVFKDHSISNPKGFFLVMYKDGTLDKVDGKDVRIMPNPKDPEVMIPVFPRMKVYDAELPQLPPYQNIG